MGTSRYAIVRPIGSGGMAEVMEAVVQGESGFTRRVAVKRMHRIHAEDPSFVRMFLDEARIASRLHHAGIVGIVDYGVVDGVPFQILEFVEGDTARELANRGRTSGNPMPLDVALYILTEVAHALHYAHTSGTGIVHRDVKPANILVSRTGDVKLADFGIAFAAERLERTNVGVAKGTPGYMAPEQLVGGAVDARADVFALGCTLHALASGETPLARAENLERLLTRERLELDPNLPDDVAAIVRRATEASPAKRYATADAMAADLGVALAARLRTDAKGALLQWLGTMEARPTAAPAALDALLMPSALLERNGDDWHMETKREDVPAPIQPRSPRRRRALVVVAALALAGISVTVAFRHPPMRHPQAAAAVAVDAEAEPSTVVSTVTPALPERLEPAASNHPPNHPHLVIAPASTSSPADVRGTLAIRGGTYRGASVSIDGKLTAYGAPHYFDLPIGKHLVDLRQDGGVVASSTVELRPDHTPTAPLYWP